METAPLLQKFLTAQPRAFGAVLVLLGLLQSAFGTLFLFFRCSYTDGLGIHFFSGILLFLAGIIAITADRVPRIGLVKACMVFQILAAAVAVAINCLYVRDILYFFSTFCPLADRVNGCSVRMKIMFYCTGLRSISFSAGTMGFLLTVSLAALGCKAICYRSSEDTVPVIGLRSRDVKPEPEPE